MYAFVIDNFDGQMTPVDNALKEAAGRFDCERMEGDARIWTSMGVLNVTERGQAGTGAAGEIYRDHYIALNAEGALWLMVNTPPDAAVYWTGANAPSAPAETDKES